MQRSLGALDLAGELLLPIAVAILGGLLIAFGSRSLPALRSNRIGWLLVGGLMGFYLLTIGGLALARHNALKSHAYDLGIFSQVLWNTSQGRWFQNTVMIEYAENLLGQHFAPIFLLLAPIAWVWPDSRALLVLQTVALAAGAVPVFLLARRQVGFLVPAVLLAAAYLALPALHYINFYDFHEIALTTPLLLFAVYFLVTNRLWLLFGCLAVSLLCREEIAIIVVAFGLALLVRRRWLAGVACIAVGVGWGVATIGYLVPYFQEASSNYFLGRYSWLGGSFQEILATIVSRPDFVVTNLVGGPQAADRAAYLIRLFVPLGGIALLNPVVLISAPTFGYLLLSDYKEQYDIVNQYAAPLLPFLVASTVLFIGRVARGRAMLANGLAGYVLVASVISGVQFGPTPIGRRYDAEQFTATDHTRLGYNVMAMIPPGASVSSQSDLVPHLTNRRELYLFPYLHGADYVLVDNWTSRWPLTESQWTQARDEMLANPMYELIYVEDGYGLFRKRNPLPIQQPLSVSFLNKIELVGIDAPTRPLRPGETVEIGLYWRAMTPIGVRRIKDRFVTSLKLTGADGATIQQIDKEPWDGLITTDRLIQGEIHRERYAITAPAAPGEYDLTAGLYSFYSKRPLAIFDEAGQRTEQFGRMVATLRVE